MRMSGAFPSDYLKAADLNGCEVTVKMDHVEIKEVGKDKDVKPVLFFQGAEKGLVLNKTNATKISQAYGDESDEWQGKPIVLYEAEVQFGAETVPGIRVRIPKAATATPTTPQRKVGGMSDAAMADDEIPF